MGKVLTIPGTLISAYAPPVDPIFTNVSKGPLVLFEPGHPSGPLSFIPADGAPVPNLASSFATTTTGSAAPLTLTNTFGSTSAMGRVERTTKGGFHVINSQTQQEAPYQNLQIQIDQALRTYIDSNVGHVLYLSAWAKVTRKSPSTYTNNVPIAKISAGYTNASHYAAVGVTTSNSGWHTPIVGTEQNKGFLHDGSGDAFFSAIASTGSFGGTYANTLAPISILGPRQSSEINNMPSVILYRIYMEDLTVSGRSFSQVSSMDQILYQANVASSGGRYFGDTYRDPASLA